MSGCVMNVWAVFFCLLLDYFPAEPAPSPLRLRDLRNRLNTGATAGKQRFRRHGNPYASHWVLYGRPSEAGRSREISFASPCHLELVSGGAGVFLRADGASRAIFRFGCVLIADCRCIRLGSTAAGPAAGVAVASAAIVTNKPVPAALSRVNKGLVPAITHVARL